MCNHHSHLHCGEAAPHTKFMPRRKLLQGLAAGGAIAASSTVAGCTTNPYTGRKQVTGFAPKNLSDAAASSWTEIKQKIPRSNDPRYTRRLRNIGNRIARTSPFADQAWDYEVFDTNTKNAFVLPGNRVGFYKGMMDFAETDDAIAAIMGHEVGHVSGRHAQERISRQMVGQLVTVGGTVIGGKVLTDKCKKVPPEQRNACQRDAARNTQRLYQALGLGALLGITLPYSRLHETESDLLGVNYMHRAGYDPQAAVKLWEKMAASSKSRQPTILSTHPQPSNRARTISAYIQRQEALGSQGFEGAQNIKEFLG
jgi:predicted Zn-dependent protease